MECSCRMFDRLSLLDLAECAEGEREREKGRRERGRERERGEREEREGRIKGWRKDGRGEREGL